VRTDVLVDGIAFGESPRWHDDRLHYSDFRDRSVYAVGLDAHSERLFDVAGRPSGLGWLPDASMVVVSMLDRRILRWDGFSLREHADLSRLTAHPCNDMVVDAAGNAYVGGFGFDFDRAVATVGLAKLMADPKLPTAAIHVITPAGETRVVADGLRFPNGMVLSNDGHTLVVAESLGCRLTAFEVGDDLNLRGRRVWADLTECGVAPDGIAADENGGIWVADPLSRRCVCVNEGARLERVVETTQPAIACAVGAGRLFVITAGDKSASGDPDARRGRIEVMDLHC
jgi:sugar lactone lactonase YvrE